MEYLLAALAFLAAVTGIIGKTWKSGRPTALGWLAGSVALCVLVLSVVQEARKEREERKIAAVAYSKVLRSIHGLVEPFAILLADVDLRLKEPGNGPTELNGKLFRYANAAESDVGSEELLEVYKLLPQLADHEPIVDSYHLGDQTWVLGKTSPRWSELFDRTALRSLQDLDSTMNTYRSVMDLPSIAAVERLRDDWLVQRVTRIPEGKPADSLGGFLHLTDTINGAPEPVLKDFLSTSETAQRLCREKLKASR